MKIACVLLIFVITTVVQCHLDSFLEAFPSRNDSEFLNLPLEVFMDHDLPPFIPRTFAACPSIPVPPDTNDVNNLRPGNIKVLLTMGDSIIAGMAAKDTNVLSLKEYRGLAFCIGADANVNTFPNILQQFAGNRLVGTSTGIGQRTSAGNGLNGAVSGAVNKDMLGQAQWLVQQLQANPNVKIQEDWMVLTIWIGSNNLCAVCNDDAANNGANFELNINSALNYIFSYVPKLFVNLIANLDVSTLYNVNSGTCGLLHSVACSCVGTSDATKRAKVSAVAKDYVALATKISGQFNARKHPTQAVVVQPFLTNNIISDRSLLSAADCFHPSASAHELASIALWNNMISPREAKKLTWDKNDSPICPTADTLIYTY